MIVRDWHAARTVYSRSVVKNTKKRGATVKNVRANNFQRSDHDRQPIFRRTLFFGKLTAQPIPDLQYLRQ